MQFDKINKTIKTKNEITRNNKMKTFDIKRIREKQKISVKEKIVQNT